MLPELHWRAHHCSAFMSPVLQTTSLQAAHPSMHEAANATSTKGMPCQAHLQDWHRQGRSRWCVRAMTPGQRFTACVRRMQGCSAKLSRTATVTRSPAHQKSWLVWLRKCRSPLESCTWCGPARRSQLMKTPAILLCMRSVLIPQ